MTDEHVPPGWDTNPSAASQRRPTLVLAIAGILVASYLALFQLGVVATAWDPFFGDGTRVVLTSELARTFPIPDASLGAVAYLFEAITDEAGGEGRWHERPWLVVAFGLAVAGLGMTAIVLSIVQPVVLDTWCTLCLASAAISITIVGPASDEVLATLQYLRWAHDEGHSLRTAFLKGTRATPRMTVEGAEESEGGLMVLELVRDRWPRVLSAVLGLWLMAAPAMFGYGEPASAVHRIIGPVAAAVAIVSVWGHMRPLRWLHPPLGGLLIIVPPLLGVLGDDLIALANGVLVGLVLIGLGFVRGRVTGRYGSGWSSLWTGDTLPESTDDGRG